MTAKTVGLYCGADTIVKDPGYLDALQEAVGLNLILTGGGFNLSRELRESAPYITPEGRQGAGLGWSDDDANLHRAIELCHAKGIAVWFVIGGWHGGAENYRDFCARDLWGRPMFDLPRPKHALETGLAVCPSRSELNDWRKRGAAEIAQRYDIQGVDITHARNIAPAYLPAWWSCGCEHCQRRASPGLRLRAHAGFGRRIPGAPEVADPGPGPARRRRETGADRPAAVPGAGRRAGRLVQLPRRHHIGQPARVETGRPRRDDAAGGVRQRHVPAVVRPAGRPPLRRFRRRRTSTSPAR